MPRSLALTALLPVLLAIACAGKGPVDSDDGLPHIRIVTPLAGTSIGTCLRMTVEVDNYEVVPPPADAVLVDGQGHWQMVVNDEPLLIPCEALACSLTLDGHDDGPLTIRAVLADNNYVKLADEAGAYVEDTASYTLARDGVNCQ
ncbi:MAG: hypothetical protein EXR69_04960 [Myxococcales bacterium]|nr:hypothetical protein [Myxococcales bacterium]